MWYVLTTQNNLQVSTKHVCENITSSKFLNYTLKTLQTLKEFTRNMIICSI